MEVFMSFFKSNTNDYSKIYKLSAGNSNQSFSINYKKRILDTFYLLFY